MRKSIAIVLGGTVPHISLIRKLKERGYYTILIDCLNNPPAKEFADEHIQESTLDQDTVLEITRSRKADLVISTCVDQANSVCCYVAEKLNLPHPYSYEISLDVTDKRRMKRIMIESGIPTSHYCNVEKLDEFNEKEFCFPLMVKPADSNSANGVKKVSDLSELKEYFPIAKKYSRNGYVILEEFVKGIEVSVYCLIINNKAHILMAQERLSVIEGNNNVIKCYASYAPARISPEAMEKCGQIATKIANSFHLNNIPLFFQGIVEEDKVNVIEFAARVGGGISSETIKYGTGFDIIDASIDSFLNKPINIDNWHPMEKQYAVNQIYGCNGIYSHTDGVEDLLQKGIVENISFYKNTGDVIDNSRASSSRIGVMVFSGNSESEIRNKIHKAFQIINCIDIDGKSIIRRDLNLDVIH